MLYVASITVASPVASTSHRSKEGCWKKSLLVFFIHKWMNVGVTWHRGRTAYKKELEGASDRLM